MFKVIVKLAKDVCIAEEDRIAPPAEDGRELFGLTCWSLDGLEARLEQEKILGSEVVQISKI